MEIYRNRATEVRFAAPLPDALYSIEVNSPNHKSVIQDVRVESDYDKNIHKLVIPIDFQHTWYDGNIRLDISVNGGTPTVQHTYSEYIDVITPLFTHDDLDGAYPAEKTPELERLVRKVIETFTGQTFGKKIDRVHATTAQQVIQFNAPLIMLTDLSWGGRHAPLSTTLNPPKIPHETIENGFGLIIDWNNYDPKTDSLWVIRSDTPRIVSIEGVFGYDRVPADVKEAALLIAGVWGTKQAVWRDRYIQIMRSADWSVQYHERAFLSTGSATADQLLSKYQRTALPEVF